MKSPSTTRRDRSNPGVGFLEAASHALDYLRSRLDTRLAPVGAVPGLGERALEHVRNLVAMGPRYPGSPASLQQLDYICATLERAGLSPRRDRWPDPSEGVEFENVAATVTGHTEGCILIACHHDTKRFVGHPDPKDNFRFVGANDGGSGVGLLLALAPVLVAGDRRTAIELAFFDGEESMTVPWNNAARALFGSRRYVRRYEARRAEGGQERIHAMLLLDMVGYRHLRLDDDAASDPRMKKILRRAARRLGHERLFSGPRCEVGDDHQPFLQAGVPATVLIGHKEFPHWHTADDDIDCISADSLQMTGEIVLTALPEIERRYVP
jgi:hypothetical protein